jgi:hypothetical protein
MSQRPLDATGLDDFESDPYTAHSAASTSACLQNPTICSSLNLLVLMSVPSPENGLY